MNTKDETEDKLMLHVIMQFNTGCEGPFVISREECNLKWTDSTLNWPFNTQMKHFTLELIDNIIWPYDKFVALIPVYLLPSLVASLVTKN